MRITRWLGAERRGFQACPVTFRSIRINMPPNAQSCFDQTGGPTKLKIPCNFIPSWSPASYYSVTHLWKGRRKRKEGTEKALYDIYPLGLLSGWVSSWPWSDWTRLSCNSQKFCISCPVTLLHVLRVAFSQAQSCVKSRNRLLRRIYNLIYHWM